jgi:hypothetical protein
VSLQTPIDYDGDIDFDAREELRLAIETFRGYPAESMLIDPVLSTTVPAFFEKKFAPKIQQQVSRPGSMPRVCVRKDAGYALSSRQFLPQP